VTDPGLVYTSPVAFSRKERLLLAVAPAVGAIVLKALYATCRVEVRGREHYDGLFATNTHFLLGILHETLPIVACYLRNHNFHGLTSYSFDGELASRVLNQFGFKSVRGSSSRGGMKALVQLAKATDSIPLVGLTVDGPKGPRREAKAGIAIVSAKKQVPILPSAYVALSAWRMNSWDRMAIPKPFTRIVCAFGAPLDPPANLSSDLIERKRRETEESIARLHRDIEDDLGVDPQLTR
jgi:lysophospholipid acyltransferase (LPLAT)-like uncharacterized protein